MQKCFKKYSSILLMSFLFMVTQGCTDSKQIQVNEAFKNAKMVQGSVDKQYNELKSHVADKNKKGKYEMTLAVALATVSSEFPNNPAVADMVKQFTLDTTPQGSIWKGIEKDYATLKAIPSNSILLNKSEDKPKKELGAVTNLQSKYMEFNRANNIRVFDERFIDYINTLASVSKNVSPVIVDKIDTAAPLGSAFVGNPNYGEWKTDSNGNQMWSFLETYMYLSFLDNMLFDKSYNRGYNDYRSGYYNGSRYNSSRSSGYRYDSWNNNRNYSYYNDTYVDKYAKNSERKKYKVNQSNLTKKYSSTIKKDTTASKQMKKMTGSNKAFQSNLSRPKTTSMNGGKNSGASSGSRNVSQSNLSRKSSSNVRSSSRSVSSKSGK